MFTHANSTFCRPETDLISPCHSLQLLLLLLSFLPWSEVRPPPISTWRKSGAKATQLLIVGRVYESTVVTSHVCIYGSEGLEVMQRQSSRITNTQRK